MEITNTKIKTTKANIWRGVAIGLAASILVVGFIDIQLAQLNAELRKDISDSQTITYYGEPSHIDASKVPPQVMDILRDPLGDHTKFTEVKK